MINNDILIRLRYALDIRDKEMVKIFKLGGIEVTIEEVKKMLMKSKEGYHHETDNEVNIVENDEGNIKCDNFMLESFLNGFIVYKRGEQVQKKGEVKRPTFSIKDNASVNNVMLKKLKIALALTSKDLQDIFQLTGVVITNGALSAVLRKEGQRNYKECGDRYARNFLKGLAIKYRK